MSHLLIEIALRLLKAAGAAALGLVLYLVLVAFGTDGSVQLALLCWLSGAAFILLVQTGPL